MLKKCELNKSNENMSFFESIILRWLLFETIGDAVFCWLKELKNSDKEDV